MEGYVFEGKEEEGDRDPHALKSWEAQVVEAVGQIIDFWGFKRNHGRIWGLLYLRETPLAAADIREILQLSKGAVSMITREMEQWGTIKRVRVSKSQAWHFVAETNLMSMVANVLKKRELKIISRVKTDIEEAREKAGKIKNIDDSTLERLERMKALGSFLEYAISHFIETSQLDVEGGLEILNPAWKPGEGFPSSSKSSDQE